MVTIPLETLMGGLAAGQLDTGQRITAGEARRLACGAGIIPVVLGGKSQVIDVGRKRRYYTGAARTALEVRDGGCTAEGCQTAPAWCHAHHDHQWAHGGRTDHDIGRLLCGGHHRKAHDNNYRVEINPETNKITFHRRT